MKLSAILVGFSLLFFQPGLSEAQPPAVTLTEVGSPNWRPGDFQLFTAPASTQDEFFGVVDTLLPLEGPSATVYTPHASPYDMELTNGAAAGGYASQSVFDRSDIVLQPNAVYFSLMFLPDPGETGSSRDFESGPVIPNSLFPMTRNVDVWLDGARVDSLTGLDGQFNVRSGDMPFDGTSHRAYVVNVFHPWDDDPTAGPLGNYELRQTFRDVQGNGWDLVAPFTVVPEPSTFVTAFAAAMGMLAIVRRRENYDRSQHNR